MESEPVSALEVLETKHFSILSHSTIPFVSLDIDECANGTHRCDVNAVCNNTRGSHNCTCKDGFYGDGVNCTGNY